MAILSALLDDDDFRTLSDSELRTLEAKVTRALIANPEVHRAIAADVEPQTVIKQRKKG